MLCIDAMPTTRALLPSVVIYCYYIMHMKNIQYTHCSKQDSRYGCHCSFSCVLFPLRHLYIWSVSSETGSCETRQNAKRKRGRRRARERKKLSHFSGKLTTTAINIKQYNQSKVTKCLTLYSKLKPFPLCWCLI